MSCFNKAHNYLRDSLIVVVIIKKGIVKTKPIQANESDDLVDAARIYLILYTMQVSSIYG